MRILWITGALLPEATASIRGEAPAKWNDTGSWILGAAKALRQTSDAELYMLSVSQDVSGLKRVDAGGIVSYAIPYGKGIFTENREYNKYMKTIRDEVRPDVVHIHGTEFSHAWAWLQECGSRHTVISIQGMTSVYANHFCDGLTTAQILSHISFRDLIRGGILRERQSFRRRGAYEQAMLRMVQHVIGRTSWDKAHVEAINPHATYHFGNETLRDAFYDALRWDYARCRHHVIFLSQSLSPFKGLHQLLKAMPLILRRYPDTQVRVAGKDPTLGYQASAWWRITGYGRIIKRLIEKNHLKQHITFIGQQDTRQMVDELLSCNLFLCPSAIENSPNSLGEAQILGVPCVASYVGGVMDMMRGNEDCLYRFEDVEMLASKVCQVFDREGQQTDMTAVAAQRHHRQKNAADLVDIYRQVSAD